MRADILERVVEDLLSISPLIFRGVRRKLIKTTLVDIDLDITPLHFEVIRLLKEEGILHVAEIGERLQIAKAQMTHIIDKLVALNVVEREIDATDRRTTSITLTIEGNRVLEENRIRIVSAVRETMSCLTDEELEDLSDSLRKLRDILSKLW